VIAAAGVLAAVFVVCCLGAAWVLTHPTNARGAPIVAEETALPDDPRPATGSSEPQASASVKPAAEAVALAIARPRAPVPPVPPLASDGLPGEAVGKKRDTPPAPEPGITDPGLVRIDDAVKAERPSGTYGTTVDFVDSPADAAQQALKERKLLFVMHISGNFEDARFT
jgi:hypothetical protein